MTKSQKVYNCLNCNESYCYGTPNHHKEHIGSCERFLQENIAINEFELLLKTGKVKLLKCCSVPAIKTEGCDHITCPNCSKDSCYICLEVFPTGSDVYQHIQTSHN